MNGRPGADQTAQPHDAVSDGSVIEDAPIGNHRVIDLRAVDFRAGQKARPGENRRAHIKEIESRQLARKVQVCLEKCPDGADILPVSLKNIREHALTGDRAGNDVFAEIGESIVQQAAYRIAVKDVDAH